MSEPSMSLETIELYVRESLSTIRRVREDADRNEREAVQAARERGEPISAELRHDARHLQPNQLSSLGSPLWRLVEAAGGLAEYVPDAVGVGSPTSRGFKVVEVTADPERW